MNWIEIAWPLMGGACLTLGLIHLLVAIPNINAIGFGVSLMAIFAVTVPAIFIWQSFRIRRGLRRAREGKTVADNPTRWS